MSTTTPSAIGVPTVAGHATREDDEWLRVAQGVAEQLAVDALERDRAGEPPHAPARLLREAGLLKLIIPEERGGHGRPFRTALAVVRQLAQVDSGVARVLAYHLNFSGRLAGGLADPAAYEDFQRRVAEYDWLVGSTGSPQDDELTLTPDGDGWLVNGVKSFATAAVVADRIVGFALAPDDSGNRWLFELDARRPQLTFLDDWDILGQRQSGSNGLELRDYRLAPEDLLGDIGSDEDPDKPAHRTIDVLSFQLVFIHLYLGISEGALLSAREYTRTRTRPWIHSGVDDATQDPAILRIYGELVARVQALRALADRAQEAVAALYERGEELTARERAEAATLGAAAKVIATQTVLEVTSRVFEATGARSAKRSVGLDLYWRNARTDTLHSPVAYKIDEVGRFFLNDTLPTPSAYR